MQLSCRIEQLRCNTCQAVFKAPLPKEVLEDGDENQEYAYTARALMAINKFYTGTPYNHQENLTDMLGYYISASTIFDQCEYVANDSTPVFYELKRLAATAELFLIDDTHHRILEQQPELRDKPSGKGQILRTGIFSSGMIATTVDAFHQKYSLPVMTSIQTWAQKKKQSASFEEHSAIGKAVNYFLNYYGELTLFCKEPGAPIDNNRMEKKLKMVIRGRKTSHFYKTANSTGVANVLISLIATVDQAGINSYDYLIALKRNRDAVKKNPKKWLPWNYHKTLATEAVNSTIQFQKK